MIQTNIKETGYIYIIYSEMYNHHGENVFKVGKSKDVINRMSGYTTSYVKPVELKLYLFHVMIIQWLKK